MRERDYCLRMITERLGEHVQTLAGRDPVMRQLRLLIYQNRREVEVTQGQLFDALTQLGRDRHSVLDDLRVGRDPDPRLIHTSGGEVTRLQERLAAARQGFLLALTTTCQICDIAAPEDQPGSPR